MSIGKWIAVAVGVVALLALALFQGWMTLQLAYLLIVGLAASRLIP